MQARGPIHEGFAQPATQQQEPSPPIAKKPPEPIDELPPDQKPEGEDVQWISGYWAWDDDRADFLWVSGIWRVPPPDHRWFPGYWLEGTGGWQWVSGYWSPVAETSVQLYPAPPEPINEAIAPPANADSVYVPGIWVYRETRFWWRPGHWIVLRPGWVWAPACYYWTPAGYYFFAGGWDRDLYHRGMCFAPIYFDARWQGSRDWNYRPRHIVRVDFLLSALFVNSGRHHYHFGDYYDAGYARRGYMPWVDYRIRTTAYDPLFAYYRWENRSTAQWDTNLRAVYASRRDNQGARPPRTYLEQERAPKDKKFAAVSSFEAVKVSGVKLAPVPKTQATELLKNAAEWQRLSKARGTVEVAAKVSVKKGAAAAPVKLELPKTTFLKTPASTKAPPPPPETPKVQDPPKDKTVKDGFKDKTPKDDPFKDKTFKDKTPKDDPFKDKTPKDKVFKDKTPKDDPFKDKTPKDKPFKDKTPKDDPFKDKSPKDKIFKDDPLKDKTPKVDPFKDKLPKDFPPKDKLPKEPPPPIKDKSPNDGPGKDKKDKEKPPKEKGKDKDKEASTWRDRGLSDSVTAPDAVIEARRWLACPPRLRGGDGDAIG